MPPALQGSEELRTGFELLQRLWSKDYEASPQLLPSAALLHGRPTAAMGLPSTPPLAAASCSPILRLRALHALPTSSAAGALLEGAL